jgi:hypothetical protein
MCLFSSKKVSDIARTPGSEKVRVGAEMKVRLPLAGKE